MDFIGSHHAKPNRPYLHQQNVQEDYRGRENQERSRYSIRSSLAGRQYETETQEALDNGADNITKVQYGLSSGYQQTQQIQDSPQQQVPGLS
ncbi:unnamed protein product [Schistosoma margrebowiei]|uniref:Uncharacterized protein n=1 Tax=Schistosoma margrebowiei TaxID=48269 RepID=A0A183N0V1_9TREM|nr:unnamed protein product [Schistosoma margrebowiei]